MPMTRSSAVLRCRVRELWDAARAKKKKTIGLTSHPSTPKAWPHICNSSKHFIVVFATQVIYFNLSLSDFMLTSQILYYSRSYICTTFCFLFKSQVLSCSSFTLPSSRNLDTGLHCRVSSPALLTTVRAMHFMSRRFQSLFFIPSSTRVEVCLPTLGAISSLIPFLYCFRK